MAYCTGCGNCWTLLPEKSLRTDPPKNCLPLPASLAVIAFPGPMFYNDGQEFSF